MWVRVLTVKGPALIDDIIHGADSLLDGSRHIGAVTEYQVHIVQPQATQRSLHATNVSLTLSLFSWQVAECGQRGTVLEDSNLQFITYLSSQH